MAVNLDKPQLWKADTQDSVDYYNAWFIKFAPKAYKEQRATATEYVKKILLQSKNLTLLSPKLLLNNPESLEMLRMSTAPPLARDRLIGLAGVSAYLVLSMEKKNSHPKKLTDAELMSELRKIVNVLNKLLDVDIFPWLNSNQTPTQKEVDRASTVVADRLCGIQTNPIIRNAQEQRQLELLTTWLKAKKYKESKVRDIRSMSPGTFAHRVNVSVEQANATSLNIPIDTVILRHSDNMGDVPILVEAKSAGDFTNTNKRRKEEATKMRQLREEFGKDTCFILFLGGYFDSGYLGYEAAEGIDWVWEHRVDDLAKFGV